jgi:hypothetical protein
MSNLITGGIAVLMALVYLLFYAVRLKSPILWIIIIVNLSALLFDYYMSIKEGEDHI